jgi:hypothetical protein
MALRDERRDTCGACRQVREDPPPESAAIHGREGWGCRLIAEAIIRQMAPRRDERTLELIAPRMNVLERVLKSHHIVALDRSGDERCERA